MSGKIRVTHLERQAIVYLRQSTMRQVHEHSESTVRQYALEQRATDLGWTADAVQVVDEDLGQSGTSTEGRNGFERVAEDVAHGRVGAIFALEVSRFARSSADWHRLLDLCGWADVLIGDEDAIYSPRDPNDRLLLGLKGQMSEAEKYWMALRMQGAKLSKAKRGELPLVPPTGYIWNEGTSRLCFDPDEAVQAAVRLVFDRFRIDGTAYAVRRYFIEQGLKIPARRLATGSVTWVSPGPRTILDMLHSPIYTGAYVWGRREVRTRLVNGKVQRARITLLPQEAWKTCIRDHHPAYISWEEFMSNQRKLYENRTKRDSVEQRGAARKGKALLQGLVICGRCGHRMNADYPSNGKPRYLCRSLTQHGLSTRVCWSVVSQRIDDAVAALFLEATQPSELELSFAITREVAHQAQEVDRQWKLRLERAQYEARLAERRYKAIDPENRVVARTLERDWEQTLRELEATERDYEAARRRRRVDLTDKDRARIVSLARDLPGIWNAPTTTQEQRKNLLRMLVRDVTLSPVEVPRRQTRVRVLWDGGAVSDFTVERPRHVSVNATPARAVERIRELVEQGRCDREIADTLNQESLQTTRGLAWNKRRVGHVRRHNQWRRPHAAGPRQRVPNERPDGLLSTHGVAARFSVSEPTVRYWVSRGWLEVTEGGGRGKAQWFKLDAATSERLEAASERRRRS